MGQSTSAAPLQSTALVTFNEGAGFHSIIRFDGRQASGTWMEDGFEVDWQVNDSFPAALSASSVLAVNDQVFLSDTRSTPEPTAESLTFWRSDGRAFDLLKFETPGGTASSWVGNIVFTPLDAAGDLDPASRVEQPFNVVYDNMVLTGVTEGGATVKVPLSSFDLTTFAGGASTFNTGGSGSFSPLDGRLTGLVSLSMELGEFSTERELFQRSLAVSNVPDLYRNALATCGEAGASGERCLVDGVGEFLFSAFAGETQNWGTAVGVDSFSFALKDPDFSPPPATVPLPSTGWMLLAAMAGVCGLRRAL